MLRTFAEAAAEYCAGVEKRVGQSLGKTLVLGVLAGAFIAFAGVAASIAGTVGGKLATAAVFPMGLAMVILGGSELFTGNCLFLLPVLGRKCRASDAARCWIAVYLANLVGAVAVALLVTGCGVLDGIAEAAIATAAGKASLSFGTAFLRGIDHYNSGGCVRRDSNGAYRYTRGCVVYILQSGFQRRSRDES